MLPSTCRLYTNYDREWMSHWRTLFQYISVKKSVGKPEFSNKLLKDKFIARLLEHNVWCYAKHQQDLFEELIKMNVEYVESIPRELGKYFKKKKRNLIMLDDLMDEALKVLNCLHVVVMTTFPLSILRKICSIKMNVLLVYMVIFKKPQNNSQFTITVQATVARQISPDKMKFLMWAYRDVISSRHNYLMFDLKPNIAIRFRVRSNFLED